MSFAQEMKDFTEGFKTMSGVLSDADKGRRENRRIDVLERGQSLEENYKDWYMKQKSATDAGFDSPEQQEEYNKKFGNGASGDDGGSTAVPSDLNSNEVYSGFMNTVKTQVQNPFALAVIASTGKRESGYSPGNAFREWDDGENNAGGIMSWNGPRLAALKQHNGGTYGTPEQQAKFFLQESPELITKLNNAKSLEEAQSIMNNAWGFKGYNQPNHPETVARLKQSRGFLGQFQGGDAAAPTASAVAPPVQPAAAPEKTKTEVGDIIEVPAIEDVASPAPVQDGAIPVPEDRPAQTSFLTPGEEDPEAWLRPRQMFAASGGVIPEYFADGGSVPAERPPVDPYSPTRNYTQPLPVTPASTFVPRRVGSPAAAPAYPTTPAGPGIQQRVRDARAGLVAQRNAAAQAKAAAEAKAAADQAARDQAERDRLAAQKANQPRRGYAFNTGNAWNTGGRSHQGGPGGYGGMGGRSGARSGGVSGGGTGLYEEGGVIPMNFAEGGVVDDEEEENLTFPQKARKFVQDTVVDKSSPIGRRVMEDWESGREARSKQPTKPQQGPEYIPPEKSGPNISGAINTGDTAETTNTDPKAAEERIKKRQQAYEKLPTPAAKAPAPATPPYREDSPEGAADNARAVAMRAEPQGAIPVPDTVATQTSRGGQPYAEATPSSAVETPITPPPAPGVSRANLPRQPAETPVARPIDVEQPNPVSRSGAPMENPVAPAPGTRGAPPAAEMRPSNAPQTPMTPPVEPAIPPEAAPAPDVAPTAAIPTPEDPTLPSGPEAPVPAERPADNLEVGTRLKFDAKDIADVKKSTVDALGTTIAQPGGAVATPEDAARKKISAERFARNADAATAAEAKEVFDAVDPQGKLSEEERLIKGLMDQRDWFLSQGLPDKATNATIAIAQYSRKMSQRYGALANEAIQRGDLDNAAKFMKRAYANIPDGRSLEYTKRDDGTFDWKVIDQTSGDVVDEGNAGADDMREMTGTLMDGSGWISMMSQQALDYGTGTGKKGGGKTSIQERQELNAKQSELYADAVEKGKAYAANPEDEDAKDAFEKANGAYNSSIGPKDEKDLSRVYLDSGLPVPPGLAETSGKGTARERKQKEDEAFYAEKWKSAEAETDPGKRAAIQGEIMQRAYEGSKENFVKPEAVEEAVSDIEDPQQAEIYSGLIEDIVGHNKGMNAFMAKKAVDAMVTKGGKIGKDGRMRASSYSFVFNPLLLPNVSTLKKARAPK